MPPKRLVGSGAIFLQKWLRRKRATAVGLNFFLAISLLAAGVVVLAGIFFFTYAVVWFGYNYGFSAVSELILAKRQHLPHRAILTVCWCFLALLFFTKARVSREYWTVESVPKSEWSSLWMAGVLGSLVALLVNASASAKTITDLLLTGPRLMSASVRTFRVAILLLRADLATCSDALSVIARRTSSISAADLDSSLPCGDSSEIFSQLAALGTVLFIRTEPPTVVLDPDLRDQLLPFFAGPSTPDFEQMTDYQTIAATPTVGGPHQLLGLAPSASLEEIRAAYRRKIKECHPDIFRGRSEEERRIAEEKTKTIIAAYAELLARYRNEREQGVAS